MPKTLLFFLFLISCGKQSTDKHRVEVDTSTAAPYDTIAIDSFSPGATTVDIVRKIKISSQRFQDSLREVKRKNEEEQLLLKAKEEKLILEKAKVKKTDQEEKKNSPPAEPKVLKSEEKKSPE